LQATLPLFNLTIDDAVVWVRLETITRGAQGKDCDSCQTINGVVLLIWSQLGYY
jgi:hypothetical protein